MKSIILCEGETDFAFLQHFMIAVNGWSDFKNSSERPNPSFKSNVTNSESRDFTKGSDMLTIISCGGCGNIKAVFEEIIRKNQNEVYDDNRYSKIVVLTDNDEEGIEEKIVSALNSACENSVDITNNAWLNISFTDATQTQFNSELLLLIIPFDEHGALETFLLESISKQDSYDAEIIKKAKNFVDSADPDKKYLIHRSFKTKAELYAYFSIRIDCSKYQFKQRKEILQGIPWEEYENIRNCFKELRNL